MQLNVHYQQYSSYNDTPNMKAKLLKPKTTSISGNKRELYNKNTNADMD